MHLRVSNARRSPAARKPRQLCSVQYFRDSESSFFLLFGNGWKLACISYVLGNAEALTSSLLAFILHVSGLHVLGKQVFDPMPSTERAVREKQKQDGRHPCCLVGLVLPEGDTNRHATTTRAFTGEGELWPCTAIGLSLGGMRRAGFLKEVASHGDLKEK